MPNLTKLTPLDKVVIIRNCIGLSVTQKSILYSIASRLGKQNFCFPSLTTLMKDSGLSKRTALVDNITALVKANIIHRISPGNGFKSNRYGINFELLVTNGYQCGNPRLLVQSPTVTSLVTDGYPKRNINKKLNEIKKEPFINEAEKAREEIRKKCGLKRKKL